MTPIGDRRTFAPLPGGGYVYTLVDEPLAIELRYLRREYGQLFAEIVARCEWAGVTTHQDVLASDYLSLSRQPARRGFAKYCAERAHTKPGEFDWEAVIDAAGLLTIEAERQGETPIVLDDAPNHDARDIEVLGLHIPIDATSMIIAHGDSLKSLILLLILGWLAIAGHVVLYLDWEWTAERHKARKRRLFGDQRLENLRYLRCRGPLTIEQDRIRRYCDEHGVMFIGGDSVGIACDGKLSDDDTAVRFHRAAGAIRPGLWAAHVPKSTLTGDGKTEAVGPFGSVFFSNLCRSTWLVKKQIGHDENLVTIALTPQKQNDGERRPAVGLEFTFSPSGIAYRNVDLLTVDGLSDKLPLALRMSSALKHGPMTLAALADELGAKIDSVIKASKRSEAFIKVLGQDGVHRLALVERRVA